MLSIQFRTSLILLALVAPAKADKFHLDTAEERAKYEGNAGDRVIEGVDEHLFDRRASHERADLDRDVRVT